MRYKTLYNQRAGPLRIVIDRDWSYWTVGLTVGVNVYIRIDVGPVGISLMRRKDV